MKPSIRMSAQQLTILQAIRDYVERHGYPPSMREVAQGSGLSSVQTVHYHIEALQRAGALVRQRGQPRSLVPADMGFSSSTSPIVHVPIAAGEREAELLVFPAALVRSANPLAIQLDHADLREWNIIRGDWLIFDATAQPHWGEIVLVRLADAHVVGVLGDTTVDNSGGFVPLPLSRVQVIGSLCCMARQV